MTIEAIVSRAFEAFRADVEAVPPLTLRGANAVDGYDEATPFDAAADEPTDAYVELFTVFALPHLDARSWRHYLPRLIAYAAAHPDDPRMAVEALVRSLRPPDRYPPRLESLDASQEGVVRAFLEQIALGDLCPHARTEAQQALEEWWLPNPTSRPTPEAIAAARAAHVPLRSVARHLYRLQVPETLASSGHRDIPQESRRVETFGGYLCGDAHTMIAVNVTPLATRSLEDSVTARKALFQGAVSPRSVAVKGSPRAVRMDGVTRLGGPGEPQTFTLVLAVAGDELVMLAVRSWPRDDVDREVRRILDSFEIVTA